MTILLNFQMLNSPSKRTCRKIMQSRPRVQTTHSRNKIANSCAFSKRFLELFSSSLMEIYRNVSSTWQPYNGRIMRASLGTQICQLDEPDNAYTLPEYVVIHSTPGIQAKSGVPHRPMYYVPCKQTWVPSIFLGRSFPFPSSPKKISPPHLTSSSKMFYVGWVFFPSPFTSLLFVPNTKSMFFLVKIGQIG